MKSFKELAEAKTTKNVHMTHIEDRVIYGGVKGAREAILALRSMRDMLAGNTKTGTNVTVKWETILGDTIKQNRSIRKLAQYTKI